MYTLYDFLSSGNGYKVRLALTQLALPFERVEIDILKGESRTPDFLALNPNGRIPVLTTPDGDVLAESNAILWYLADGTALLPGDALARARVLQWMFFEQYSHEPNIATSRFYLMHTEIDDERRAALAAKKPLGYAALDVLEKRLAGANYLVGDGYTIADIALYAYTHVADEGGFDLARFPAVQRWLARVADQPGHVPMTQP